MIRFSSTSEIQIAYHTCAHFVILTAIYCSTEAFSLSAAAGHGFESIQKPYDDDSISCHFVPMRTLNRELDENPASAATADALLCCPSGDNVNTPSAGFRPDLNNRSQTRYPHTTFPLHVFMHGDGGGGKLGLMLYRPLLKEIASYGFCVAAPGTCNFDAECNNGQTSYLEILRTIKLFSQMKVSGSIQMSAGDGGSSTSEALRLPSMVDASSSVSVSGHSTGARAVLMIAALNDNTEYLNGTLADIHLATGELRDMIPKISSYTALHPDPMYETFYNPDVQNFNRSIRSSAVLVTTGTSDVLLPSLTVWKTYQMLQSPERIFVNVLGANHFAPMSDPRLYGRIVGYFSQAFALNNVEYLRYIYAPVDEQGSLISIPGLCSIISGDVHGNGGNRRAGIHDVTNDKVWNASALAKYDNSTDDDDNNRFIHFNKNVGFLHICASSRIFKVLQADFGCVRNHNLSNEFQHASCFRYQPAIASTNESNKTG
eukprot:gene6750-8073_t